MLNFRTFQIDRLQSDESDSGYKLGFDDTGNTITGYLEKASPEFSAMVDGEFGKVFRLFSDDTDADIVIGNRVTDLESEDVYDVKGVLINKDGPGRKLEATLVLSPIQ